MDRTKTSAAMILVLLFCTGASLTSSMRLRHSVDRLDETDEKRAVAVGVPFRVLAGKGLSVNPLEYAKGSAVAIERAAVDDPRLFEIESWDGSAVLVRGLETGETTLRVQGRVGFQKQSASIAIRTAAPTGAALVPRCGDPGQRTVWVGAGERMVLEERLLNGGTLILSDRYPRVDFGPFTPPAGVVEKLQASGKPGELIGPIALEVTAPATPGRAALAIPEFGFTLPVEVVDASAVRVVRLDVVDGRAQAGGKTHVTIRFLVDGNVPCGSPAVPIELTIGPATYCELEDVAPFRRLPERRQDHRTFEGVVRPQTLAIRTVRGGGDCVIAAIVKGVVDAAAAEAKIAIYAKPAPPKSPKSSGGVHHGGGHGHH